MTMFIGTIIGLILIIGVVANYRHKKSDERYNEYLLELDEMKKRKKERNEKIIGL